MGESQKNIEIEIAEITTQTENVFSKYSLSADKKDRIELFEKERKGITKTDLNLLTECKKHKIILDIYYDDLELYNSCIQISIICVSTFSAFLQALKNEVDISDDVIFMIILCISTYISLILSITKFFKLNEKKERTHNLREKYSELHNKIRYRLDTIKAWNSEGYFNNENFEEKIEEWISVSNKFRSEYFSLIEIKQNLSTEYEKILDSNDREKYNKKVSKELLEYMEERK